MRTTTSLLALTLIATTTAFGAGPPAPVPEKVSTFKWKYPFTDEGMAGWSPSCSATKAFDAREFTLHDLVTPFPGGLGAWVDGLRGFFTGREYPGGWGGWDKHLHGRSIVYMEYADMPLRVREWIEEQERTGGEGKGLFGVFAKPAAEGDMVGETVEVGAEVDRAGDGEKVAIFAPGALYEVLPLWVAGGSDCEETLSDLSKYQPTHGDGAVVAWPKKTKPTKEKTISIEIMASHLAKKEVEASKEEGAKAGKEEL